MIIYDDYVQITGCIILLYVKVLKISYNNELSIPQVIFITVYFYKVLYL